MRDFNRCLSFIFIGSLPSTIGTSQIQKLTNRLKMKRELLDFCILRFKKGQGSFQNLTMEISVSAIASCLRIENCPHTR